jgi:DNA-binding NtrC family response regulator
LIVDDDCRVLLILKAALNRTDDKYQIKALSDGREALAEFEERPFDLVISDVVMPGLDGIELAGAIRDINAKTLLIWISAYGCHRLAKEFARLDIYRCLDKPLRIDVIRQTVQEAFKSKR